MVVLSANNDDQVIERFTWRHQRTTGLDMTVNEKQFGILSVFTQTLFVWICIVIFVILLCVSLKVFEVFSFSFALSLNAIFWLPVSYFLGVYIDTD